LKRNVLQLSDTEPQFQCLQIFTALKDYQLAFHINSTLDICLHRIPDHTLLHKNGQEYHFSAFSYDDPDRLSVWMLVSNLSAPQLMPPGSTPTQSDLFSNSDTESKTHLIPDHKQVNYWLLLSSTDVDISAETHALRQLPLITHIQPFDPSRSKYWSHLLFF
jgi:hypothetical protein